MSDIAVRVEHVSKEYRLGMIGGGTLYAETQRLWAKLRGKEDPCSKIGSSQPKNGEKFLALDDVSFEVKKGEALGIIGRNGAGKSTLLKLLTRITTPTKGTIAYNGRIASMLEVGTGFHPELTGRENVYMNGAILGMTKHEIDKKFDEIVDFAEISQFIDTPVKRYSSGMYVKLAFSVAAHLDSEIMIMDEVLAVGDIKFQQKCLGKMGEISQNEGRTVLFVSHNMGALRRLCSRGILLKRGKLIEDNTIEKVAQTYAENMTENKLPYAEFPDAPEKEMFIKKIEFFDKNGKPKRDFDITESVFIRITAIINEDTSNTNISFALMRNNERILSNWDTDKHPEICNRRKGIYEETLMIPPILCNGVYSCSVDCGHPNLGVIDARNDAISFNIDHFVHDGSISSSSRPGIIHPDIQWEIIKKGS